jgi:hypothetical protein
MDYRRIANIALVTVMLSASVDEQGLVMGALSTFLFVAIMSPFMFVK